jgi:hypothetical protein
MQWRLWHGKSDGVLRRLQVMLRVLMRPAVKCRPAATLLGKLIRELHRYRMNNADSLPDYGKRWRSGQRISSAFVESAVKQIIDKRMSKSQQMRWTHSAHIGSYRSGSVTSTACCKATSPGGIRASRQMSREQSRSRDPPNQTLPPH